MTEHVHPAAHEERPFTLRFTIWTFVYLVKYVLSYCNNFLCLSPQWMYLFHRLVIYSLLIKVLQLQIASSPSAFPILSYKPFPIVDAFFKYGNITDQVR